MSTALGLGLGLPFRVSTGFNPAALFAAGEQGAWYDPSDLTTLFQDSAGTTPVTAVEQSVGLMLDKRVPAGAGYYSGGFDASNDSLSVGTVSSFNFMHNTTALFTFECWVNVASTASQIAIVDNTSGTSTQTGFFICINAGGAVFLAITLGSGVSNVFSDTSTSTVSANTWTHIAITYDQSLASGNAKFYINGVAAGAKNKTGTTPSSGNASQILRIGQFVPSGGWFNGYISNLRITNSIVYTGAFTPSTTSLTSVANTQLLTCQNSTFIDNSPNNFTITANGGIVAGARNPFGNHAYQSTSTSRPVLRARYNLLTYSEQFDNGAYRKNGLSVSPNVATAPDGTTTADLLTGSGTGGQDFDVYPADYGLNGNVVQTFSIYVKQPTSNAAPTIQIDLASTGSVLNLSTGAITNASGGGPSVGASAVQVGNGWWRFAVTTVKTNVFHYWAVKLPSASSQAVLLWGAQLVATNSLTSNTYQRIAAATDYDTTGFLPYLFFDGTDDSLLTNSVNFTATDKMTVWAGVRKLSGTASVIAELSSNTQTDNGSFVLGNAFVSATTYDVQVRGTDRNARSYSTYTAPVTNVLQTSITTAAADSPSAMQTRVDGAVNAGSSFLSVVSTGNFGNYPLYIGRRNNATAPLNGNLYSLIIRGAQSTASQISATEAWVNSKTGAY